MRTTLDVDNDVLLAVKERARRENRSAGAVLSGLAREALTGTLRGAEIAETPSFYGFEPFPHRGPAISNAVLDQLREDEPE
ncbi:MAG: antitoxin [Thermoanaerobaculia bacterium]